MEGTFTEPMPTADGGYLFWDNATYMKQLGLAP